MTARSTAELRVLPREPLWISVWADDGWWIGAWFMWFCLIYGAALVGRQ